VTATLALDVDAQQIPVRNAWYLLLYAWDLAAWQGAFQGEIDESPNLRALLARILIQASRDLMREQLGREFRTTTREIASLRGKIDIAASLKRNGLQRGRLTCRFDELGIDTPRNRILKASLERLLADADLEVGGTPVQAVALRHDLKVTIRMMDGVRSTRLSGSDFSRLQLGRNDARYRLPLAICSLLHFGRMPTEAEGDHLIASLLRDEMAFSQLFERFVRHFYRQHLSDCVVRSEVMYWPVETASPLMPRMQTDTSIERGGGTPVRVVLDTKYYRSHLMASHHDSKTRFHSTNLYQMYAYLRTQEDKSTVHRVAAGVLLYPTTSEHTNEVLWMQGHAIRVTTIDLSRPWMEIDEQLMQLAFAATDDATPRCAL
jgi:5-methylcytosine-specific restriction enzyme subunit McrC